MRRLLVFLFLVLLSLTAACKQSAAVIGPVYTPAPSESVPTPDPKDALFAKAGKEIVVYQKAGVVIDPYAKGAPLPDYWFYNSYDLRVEIKQFVDTEKTLVYYVADIRLRNGMREKAAFGSMTPPGTKRNKPCILARSYGSVVAINGDYLVYVEKEIKGILIRDGKVYQEGKKEDTLAFFPDNSLRVFAPGETTAQALVDQGVVNAYSFGPTMVKDGVIVQKMSDVRGINSGRSPRSGVGMIEPGHLVAIMVEGRIKRSRGMNINEFAQLFVQQGCSVAYNFDGGASASIVFLGNMCNLIMNDGATYLGPRPLTDMLTYGKSALCPGVKDPFYNFGQVIVDGPKTTPTAATQ